MTDHLYDDIEEFAVGGLPPEKTAELLRHADACPSCAVLVSEAMAGVAALAEADGERDVHRPLARPLVRRARLPVRASWIASAVAAAACVGLLVWNIALQRSAPSVPIAAIVHSHFTHHALTGPSGSAKVLQALDGHWLYVVGDGLAPRGRYALWEDRGTARSEVGEFSANGAGQAAAYFEQPPGEIKGFAVTRAGTDPAAPQALHWP